MKTSIKTLLCITLASSLLVACSKEEVDKGPQGPVYTSLASSELILLGAQTNPNIGSFYSISQDSIYFTSIAGMTSNQSKIDLIFYFLGSLPADSFTIAAPTDPIFGLPDDQTPHRTVKTWTTKNATTFLKLNINAATFMNLENDSLFQNDLVSNVTATKINKLKVGDVVGFKTSTGKLGAYHIRAINNIDAINRAMTIDVKVQE